MITDHKILGVATMMYLALFFMHVLYFASKKKGVLKVISWTLYATVVVQALGLCLRWIESYRLGIGHVPLSNYYESLIFFPGQSRFSSFS